MEQTQEQKEKIEKLCWEKVKGIKIDSMVVPLVNELVLIIEEEKKRTMQQIEDTKKLVERLNNCR